MRLILWAAMAAAGAYATPGLAQKTEDYHDKNSPLFHDTEGDSTTAATGDSFPTYIVFGDAPAPDWTKAPPEAKAPAPLVRHFSVKGCNFVVKTSDYAINQYDVAGVSEYAIEQARVPEKSVLKSIVGGSIYVSVSADLEVDVESQDLAACKKAFETGRRGHIPTLQLTAEPFGVTDDGKRLMPTGVIKQATSDALYIAWSTDRQTLVLTNKEGGDAMIESAACEFKPDQSTTFYLSFPPGWKVVKAKDLVAKQGRGRAPAH